MLTVLIAVAVIILVILILKYPPLSLALFLMTPFFKAALMLKFPIFRVVDYTVMCGILVLIAMAYSFIRSGGRLKDILSIPLFVYLLLAAILLVGVTYTSAPKYGLQKSSRFATLGLIAFLAPIVFAHSVKEVKLMIWIIIGGGILLAVGTIVEPYAAVLRTSAETRAGFLESSPLATATKIGVAATIFLLFAIMAHTSLRLRIASLTVLPLMIAGMVITGSRGPFLGLILTWLVAIFICRRGISKAWIPVITAAISIAMIVSFAKLPEIATTRIANMWRSRYDMTAAAYARTERFVWTADRFVERPVLGHGTGAFAVDRGGQDIRAYPHNIILELLYEQGLIGAAVLLIFLWLIFSRWRQAARLVYLYELDIGIFQIVHMAGLLFLLTLTQAMKSGDIDGNRMMFFFAGLVVAEFNLVRAMAEEISLENELIPEGQQDFEGFELQDGQFLYY